MNECQLVCDSLTRFSCVIPLNTLGKRFYEDPPAPSNSNTKKTRRNESVPAIHLTPKSTATTLEQRKKKVETEWRKAVQKQHTERETNTNSELEQVRDGTED